MWVYLKNHGLINLAKVESISIKHTIAGEWYLQFIAGNNNYLAGEYKDEESARTVLRDIGKWISGFDYTSEVPDGEDDHGE